MNLDSKNVVVVDNQHQEDYANIARTMEGVLVTTYGGSAAGSARLRDKTSPISIVAVRANLALISGLDLIGIVRARPNGADVQCAILTNRPLDDAQVRKAEALRAEVLMETAGANRKAFEEFLKRAGLEHEEL